MKHYIGNIMERDGDFEYNAQFIFQTAENPNEYMDNVARNWRGDPDSEYDESLEGYWCDGTLISADGFDEIPASDFEVLKKYMSVL